MCVISLKSSQVTFTLTKKPSLEHYIPTNIFQFLSSLFEIQQIPRDRTKVWKKV